MGTQQGFIRGLLHPEVQPFTLLYTILDRKGSPFVYILFLQFVHASARGKFGEYARGVLEFLEAQPRATLASCSAVARGGAGGACAPPVFFLKSKNRPV